MRGGEHGCGRRLVLRRRGVTGRETPGRGDEEEEGGDPHKE
jgi:hypothetical protein